MVEVDRSAWYGLSASTRSRTRRHLSCSRCRLTAPHCTQPTGYPTVNPTPPPSTDFARTKAEAQTDPDPDAAEQLGRWEATHGTVLRAGSPASSHAWILCPRSEGDAGPVRASPAREGSARRSRRCMRRWDRVLRAGESRNKTCGGAATVGAHGKRK